MRSGIWPLLFLYINIVLHNRNPIRKTSILKTNLKRKVAPMNCFVCGEPIKALTGTKLKHGMLCKDCANYVPSILIKKDPYVQEYTLKHIIEKTKEHLEEFYATSSFGDLHIDEIHGLFAISKGLDEHGKPKGGSNIFSVYDLTEVGLTCTSPRADHTVVKVDAEFSCTLENPFLSFKEIVKRGCNCQTKIKGQNLAYDEPHDMQMFKVLFNQLLTGTWEKVNAVLCGKTVYAFELEKARAVFMLPADYTLDDLNAAYRKMKTVYGEDPDSREMSLLNKYYYFLQSDLRDRRFAQGRKG